MLTWCFDAEFTLATASGDFVTFVLLMLEKTYWVRPPMSVYWKWWTAYGADPHPAPIHRSEQCFKRREYWKHEYPTARRHRDHNLRLAGLKTQSGIPKTHSCVLAPTQQHKVLISWALLVRFCFTAFATHTPPMIRIAAQSSWYPLTTP